MFKQVSLTLLIILCSAAAFGQKIKFKKGEIQVDKVPLFHFEKTSEKGEAFAYAMTNLEGDTLLKFSDHDMEYVKLPHENSARIETTYCKVEALEGDGKEGFIKGISLNEGSQFTYSARKTSFLTATGLDYDKWEDYLVFSGTEDIAESFAEVEEVNGLRSENAVKSQRKFGDFTSRDKGNVYRRGDKVVCSGIIIGKVVAGDGVEKEKLLFSIKSKNGKHVIATVHQKKDPKVYEVRTLIDFKRKAFKLSTANFSAFPEPYQHGMNYLVNYGYL